MKPEPPKIAFLIIGKYPLWAVPFAFFSMALFRLPLWLNKRVSFWKLMGSGRNGTFDLTPDLQQWGLLLVTDAHAILNSSWQKLAGSFITGYIRLFGASVSGYKLKPIEGHGLWNGKEAFGALPKTTDYAGEIAIMTRATIRISRLRNFWKHVDGVAMQMAAAEGFVQSHGLGEVPFVRQATFSIWKSKEHMRQFAYRMQEHKEVIRKTYAERWYSEEMFVRFVVLDRL